MLVFALLFTTAVAGAAAVYLTPSEESVSVEQAEVGPGLEVDEDSEAYAAGLRDGDVLLSVNGTPFPDSLRHSGHTHEFTGAYGDVKRLRVRRGDVDRDVLLVLEEGEVRNARALGLSAAAVDRALSAVWYVALLSFIAAALGLFVRARGRGYLAALAQAMLIFAAAFGLGAGSEKVFAVVPGDVAAAAVALLLVILAVSALPALVSALVRFPNGVYTPVWTRRAGRWSIGFVVLAISALAILEMVSAEVPQEVEQIILITGLLGSIGIPLVGLVQKYRRAADAAVRQRMKWVVLPLGVFLLVLAVTAITDLIAPSFGGDHTVGGYLYDAAGQALAALAAMAIPLGVLAGALNFRPWDADLWIGRSVSIGAATLGLAAVFAGAAEGLRLGMVASLGEGGQVAAAATAAVLSAVLFNPIRERVQAWVERDRVRRRRTLTQSVPRLLGGRQAVAAPDALAALALRRVRETLATEEGAVYTWAGGGLQPLALDRVEAAAAEAWAALLGPSWADVDGACQQWGREPFVLYVPLRTVDGDLVGALALGPHGRRGRGYSTDEQAAIVVAAEALAEALVVSQARETERAADRAALAGLLRQLDGLAGRGDGAAPVPAPSV